MGAGGSFGQSQDALLCEFEKAVLARIKEVRTTQGRSDLIKRLEDRLPYYDRNQFKDPKSTIVQIKMEGKVAVEDALRYLKDARADVKTGYHPLESDFSLVPSVPLTLSSSDHAFDVGQVGIASHESSNGDSPSDRISRYCCWKEACSEVIYYGSLDGGEQMSLHDIAQDVIDELIIDDGVESRGHRLALFDGRFQIGGVGVAPHSVYGNVVVVNLAAGTLEDDDVSEGETIVVRGKEAPQDLVEVLRERRASCEKRKQEGPLSLSETLAAVEKREAEGNKQEAGTQWGNMGTCCGCGKEVRGGRVMEVGNSKDGKKKLFHADCFCCSECEKHLKGVPFREREDASAGGKKNTSNPFVCDACWARKYAPRCGKCGESITERALITDEGMYHPQCFDKEEVVVIGGSGGGPTRGKAGGGAPPRGRSLEGAKNKMKSIISDYGDLDAWVAHEDGISDHVGYRRRSSTNMAYVVVMLVCLSLSVLATNAEGAGGGESWNWAQELYNVSLKRQRTRQYTGPGLAGRLEALHLIRVPKAASSSLSQVARRMAGCDPPGPCCEYPGEPRGSCPSKALFACASEAGGPIFGCVRHKSNYAQLLNDSIPSITVLREPISRSISAYHYPGVHHNSQCGGKGSLQRCFSEYVSSTKWSNVVVKLLSGANAYAPKSTCRRAAPGRRGRCDNSIETAIKNLGRLSFVGIAELWEASVLLLYERFPQLQPLLQDFKMQTRADQSHRGGGSIAAARTALAPRDLSYDRFKEAVSRDPGMREALYRQNSLDVVLYRLQVRALKMELERTGLWAEERVRQYWEDKYPQLYPYQYPAPGPGEKPLEKTLDEM